MEVNTVFFRSTRSRKRSFFTLLLVTAAFPLLSLSFSCKRKVYKHSVLIKSVPHELQQPDFCGEACVTMFLRKFGLNIRQEDIFARCKVSPLTGRGCVSMELYKALERMGFRPGDAFHSMNYRFARTSPEEQWDIIYKRLTRGIPTIVCMLACGWQQPQCKTMGDLAAA